MSLEVRVLPELPPLKVSQSLAGYVREHLDQLEALLFAGTRYEVILQALERSGLNEPSYGALDNALWRARRRAREKGSTSIAPAPSVKASPVMSPPLAPRVVLTPTRDLKAEDLF